MKNPSADPLVSVVIPAYNAERWIIHTLESATAQTLRAIEILVVDDGLSDGTADLAENFASHDPRVRIIRQDNQGVGAARNTAIQLARGAYVAPLDADDLWQPTKLEKQVACMERYGERIGMVYCDSRFIDESGTPLAHGGEFISMLGNCRKRLIYYNFLGNASVPLFKTEALRRCGLYLTREEQYGSQGCEDWDLALRVAEQWDVAAVPERLVGYRQVAACMSGAGTGMNKSFQVVVERARKRNPDLPPALFNWSEARFQRWIFRKCYHRGDGIASLRAANRAIMADRLMLLDIRMQRMMLKCLVREAKSRFGITRAPDPGAPTPGASPSRRPSSRWRSIDRISTAIQKRISRRRLEILEEQPGGESPHKLLARTT